MQRCAFTPYEGKKPYIFVSYAHKDSHRVFPILEELDRRGYRVWYDDGIAPGSEWPENIAQHLDGCSLTLAFISPSSIASANCRREVTFALSKRKPFLGILLEPTEMSLGMEMQLSAQQCIMKYTYQDDGAFFSKVCSCPDLQPCLGQPKPAPQPAAPTPAPVIPTPAPVSVPKPAPVPKEKKPLDKKLLAIIGGAVAAVAVLAIVLVIALSGGKDPGPNLENTKPTIQTTAPTHTTGQTTTTMPPASGKETHLQYNEKAITAEDIAYINQQSQLEVLEFHRCQFQANVLDNLSLPDTLHTLIMSDCEGISKLQFLNSLQNLAVLELNDNNLTNSMLSQLSIPSLKELNISGNTNLSSLSFLAGSTGLESLDFSETKVSDIGVLASMEALWYVNGSDTEVADITPLADLTELLEIYFAFCRIETIDKPFYSLHLQVLDLSFNALTSLEAFDYCAVLDAVYLAFNQLDSLYPISKSAATLTILDVAGNENLSSNNLYFLKDAELMQQLYLDGIYLFDLDLLKNMTCLQKLSAINCAIDDLTGIEGTVSQLDYLNLAFNSIKDVSVLSGLMSEGMILDLSFNNFIDNLSELPDHITYSVLNLCCDYPDASTIPQLNVESLLLAYDYGLETHSWLKTDPCAFYLILGCPMDKVAAMENLLGRNDVIAVTEATEYIEVLISLGLDCRYLEMTLASQS